jgi:hypothetical protein
VDRLTRTSIIDALGLLSSRLPSNEEHTLVIMGGAALVLLYGARESTKDVDGVWLSQGATTAVRRATEEVAKEMGLATDWLNEAAKGFLHGLALGERVAAYPSLTVLTLAPQQLLAMKLSAWRDDVDIEDARLLLSKVEGDRASVWRQVEAYLLPGRQLKAEYAFADLWEATHGAH